MLLLIVAVAAIFVDGTLTYDIFDYRIDSFIKWVTLILVLGIFGAIALTDSTKKSEKKNNSG
ncbi:MAG: hypothetical protein IID18_07315 [Nitrospinae bacterium]|nr:hypothetical protein [Nitrospinota bacterium]